MAQENENVDENNPTVNTETETPSQPYNTSRPYRITMEFPLFFTMLSVSLSGKYIIHF